MARILAISSYVAHGHVGLAAIVPTLQRMGHDVVGLPTVVLSSHYGYEPVAGLELDASDLGAMLEALRENGWLDDLDGVVTGFMADPQSVAVVAAELQRIADEHPDVIYLCDPVMGDDPKGLYVPVEVAEAIRDRLVPLADVLTPNRFELAWLTGMPVTDPATADAAADATGAELVVVTSVPAADGLIGNLMSDEDRALIASVPHRRQVPHGTGDLMAALVLGHMIDGLEHADAVARAAAGVEAVLQESAGTTEMRLVDALERATGADPWPMADIEEA
ncbi:MAG: pyridoxal kinase [Hyphomicrobiaceae bacterium]|nr:pyridoxal kinase [Hyphomicrobiaceae bacterium]